METVAQAFTKLSLNDPALWLAVATGVAVTALLLAIRSRRRRGPVVLPQPPKGSPNWETALITARHHERRRSIRRAGLPTPIWMVEARSGKKARAEEAYVLDRSSGGLRLALERAIPVGTIIMVKPSNAPDDFEWVRMTVRNLKDSGDYFEAGCQFETELEIGRLLMFG